MDRHALPTQQFPLHVVALLDEYRAARATGVPVDAAELLRQHPDLADQLRALLDADALAPPATAAVKDTPTLDFPPTKAPGTASEWATLAGGFVPPPQASLCGATFGDYELLEEIARGGMGVVFKARQISLNRVVALKMILAGQFASPDHVRRFHVEAEEAGRLAHPHIVPIYQVGEEAGQHFYSMKLIAGGSLAAHIARYQGDPGAAARLIVTVARAVHDAHLHGVLHRDLKPGNILLDEDGQPHVTDFGLAKHLDTGGPNSNTCSGTIVGTPAYMAPEQAAAKKTLTIAADVYSLGAIFYELLTGRPPFHAASPMETLMQVIDKEPDPPRLHNPAVPGDLETICLKCLHKEPAKRYVSGLSLALDLERFLGGEPVHARPVGRMERAVKWARRRPTAAALVVVSALALTGLLVGGWWSNARMREANERLHGALAIAEDQKGIAFKQKGIAEEQTRLAKDKTRHAEEQTREADKRRKEAQHSARLAKQEQDRAEAGFRKRIGTMDDLLLNLDGQLANESGMDSLRSQFLTDFLAQVEQMDKEQQGNPVIRRQLGQVYYRLGDVNDTLRRYVTSDKYFNKALDVQRGLVKDHPKEPDYRADLALTHAYHAMMLRRGRRSVPAQKGFEEAIRLQDALVRDFPERTVSRARQRTARFRLELADMLEEQGRQPQALRLYREAVDRQELVAAGTHAPAELAELALIADSLASLLASVRPADTQRWLERALRARREAFLRAPQSERLARDLREAYTELGAFLLKRHRHAELARLSDALCEDFPGAKGDRYDAACLLGNAVTAARQAPGLSDAVRQGLADGYGERAVKLLDKAIQVGYDNRAHMDKDTDLDALRARADYKGLMANLDARLPARRAPTPAEELDALKAEYTAGVNTYRQRYARARTQAQERRARAGLPDLERHAEQMLQLAEKHKDSPTAMDAINWVFGLTEPDDDPLTPAQIRARASAVRLLERDHLDKPDLSEVCRQLALSAEPQTDGLLRAILQRHKSKDQRGIALFALGLSAARQSARLEHAQPARSRELSRQAEDKLARVARDHADVPMSKSTLGGMARKKLFEVKYLSVGREALEIQGEALDGRRVKLSDHRGKVVVLDFWANWCGYCRQQYAHRGEMAARVAGKPVALLGVNRDDDQATVQSVVARQKIPGTHWWDGRGVEGRIGDRWQIDSLPTVYILDHKGVIRYKGQLRPAEVDQHIDRLLSELAAEKGKR